MSKHERETKGTNTSKKTERYVDCTAPLSLERMIEFYGPKRFDPVAHDPDVVFWRLREREARRHFTSVVAVDPDLEDSYCAHLMVDAYEDLVARELVRTIDIALSANADIKPLSGSLASALRVSPEDVAAHIYDRAIVHRERAEGFAMALAGTVRNQEVA
jgi:hypothetical protein